MAVSCRRQLRAGLSGALAGSLAILLGACGVINTKDDRAMAVKLADKHFPGELKVIGARTLFPGTGGSEITFAVTDDRDAVVRLRVDSAKGTCHYKDCARAIADAVTRGRAEAADVRTLTGTFGECGYEVLAIGPTGTEPSVVARPTNATVTQVLAEVGACVQRWVTAGGAQGPLAKKRVVTVNLVSPRVAERRDTGKESWPTVERLSHTALLASLSERPYYAAGYDIVGSRVDTAGSARIVRPFQLREEFGRTVRQAVEKELRATYPQVAMSPSQGVWRLDAGTVDRQTGYVLFCEQPNERKRCVGMHAVLVTTDVRGNPVGELRIVRDVREGGTGPLRLPPL